MQTMIKPAVIKHPIINFPSHAPPRLDLLQRQCGCGGAAGMTGECAECNAKRLTPDHYPANPDRQVDVPSIVNEALNSPGQPLDPVTRDRMESRFGHNFRRVRVHTDARAAESARTVNAQAYTLGQEIVFRDGQYAPGSAAGEKLLAHELAHVVQQSRSVTQTTTLAQMSQPGDAAEQEAERAAHPAQAVSLSSNHSLRIARQTPAQPLTAQTGIAAAVSAAVYKLKFSQIGPLPMENMLEKLDKLSRDELLALRQNAEASAPYGRDRLELAMDVVWHRKFARAVLPEFRSLLQERMNRVIPFADQQKAIMNFLNAAAIASEKRAAVAASAKGSAQTSQLSGAGQAAISADQLSAFGTGEQTAFKRQVYNTQMKNAMRVKTFFPGLPAGEMEVVEKGQKMRKDAAQACKKLLEKARADLKQKQDEGDELAQKVTSIGVGSGYRDPASDFKIWDDLFQQYYNETQKKREEMDGGEHGAKAVQFLAGYISQYKAVGGFSNHSSGIAMDFVTTEGKETLGANKSQNPSWLKSWLHKWLVENAATYGFQPLTTEAWHWDYRGVQDAEGRPDSK